MADLFTMTAPLLIRYPDGRRHVMVERFRHPQGLLYFRTWWDRMEPARGMVLVEGEVKGEGPWKVGAAVVTVLGCQGSRPDEAREFADWQAHREQLGNRYPDRVALLDLAKRTGYLP
jgi:hypothetical protein